MDHLDKAMITTWNNFTISWLKTLLLSMPEKVLLLIQLNPMQSKTSVLSQTEIQYDQAFIVDSNSVS